LQVVGSPATDGKGETSRSARAVSVPLVGRETGNVRYFLPASVPRDESDLTLGQPCYELMKSMRRQIAEREGTHGSHQVNAISVQVEGRTLPDTAQRGRNFVMNVKAQKSIVRT